MKGKLIKTEKGWIVHYIESKIVDTGIQTSYHAELPIHPKYEKYYFLDEDAHGSKVEFEIVNETYDDGKGCTYAKLIKPNVPKLGNEDVPKLGYDERKKALDFLTSQAQEMGLYDVREDDVKDWAYLTSVSKGLDGSTYQSTYLEAFIDGYNKAKENTYTEEQMKECWEAAFSKGLSVGFECYKPLTFEEYIQSLKQPK